jgi:catechol 2,3-dioxygenase-like lactoylglutathione lyase family enzyme
MSLHGLTSITLGVPDVDAVASYYEDFGLRRVGDRPGRGLVFATADGGEQLVLRPAERRRLLEIGIGADDRDDLGRVEASLRRLGVDFERDAEHRDEEGQDGEASDGVGLRVRDPHSALLVSVQVSPRIVQAAAKPEPTNGPGRPGRPNGRAPAIEREGRVQPRRLGHVVVGSLNQEASQRFFTEGLGFKVSDRVPGLASFMRCSTDHHNLLVQQAPLNFLHHTAWEVDDIDEVGRGATAMLEEHPERHVWGLGRHHIGSNFFWYLKDPVGNFSEYYSDLDIILDDQLWKPSVVEGARGLYNWGPPPPPSFIHPEDLAALMTGSHAPKA